jgi:farnesyl diphosphate synthase
VHVDLRRGRPTCHRAHDEATAILVGDALQAFGFAVLASESIDGARPLSAPRGRPCTLARR